MTDDEIRAERLLDIALSMDLEKLRTLVGVWEMEIEGHQWNRKLTKRIGKNQGPPPQSLAGLPVRTELAILREVLKIRAAWEKRRRER